MLQLGKRTISSTKHSKFIMSINISISIINLTRKLDITIKLIITSYYVVYVS